MSTICERTHQSHLAQTSVSLRDILDQPEVMLFAIQSSINAVAFSDLEGHVVYANPTCLEMWGGDHASEIIGLPVDFFAWDRNEAHEALRCVLHYGFWEGEIRGRRKDGTQNWVYLSAYIVRDRKQSPLCLVCSFIDITENKKLQQESELKEFALQSSINAVAMSDLSGRINYVNTAFLRLWGGTEEEVQGRSISSLAWNSQQAEKFIQEVLKRGSWFGEIYGVNKTGHKIPVHLSASLVRDNKGDPLCLYCSFVDISYRQQVEEELRQAKEELEKKVKERTSSLRNANKELQEEIKERERTQQELREKQEELKQKANDLEEMNTTLQVLLEKREKDKENMERKILSQVKELVQPYLQEMWDSNLTPHQQTCLQQISSSLEDIVSPFTLNLRSPDIDLTPTQLRVAEFIKQGQSSKKIAEAMHISQRAVEFHRNSIRHRLGLQHKKINLRSYLLSLS